jgi:transcriptional regulator with XRE-family HTH domain
MRKLLRKSREVLNFSQKDLADALGMSRETLAAYENARCLCHPNLLSKLSHVFALKAAALTSFSQQLADFAEKVAAANEVPEKIDPAGTWDGFEWVQEVTEPLGWTVIGVSVKFSKPELERVGPRFEERLGDKMEELGIGMFDSMKQGDPFVIYYIAGKGKTAAAIGFLKTALTDIGLIHLCKIGVAEAKEKQWLEYYPACAGCGASGG